MEPALICRRAMPCTRRLGCVRLGLGDVEYVMLAKLLVANRGEIAVRASRAAYELGIASVAIYAQEDRLSLHRQKADEAYPIGQAGHPVRAYLNVEEIVATALRV